MKYTPKVIVLYALTLLLDLMVSTMVRVRWTPLGWIASVDTASFHIKEKLVNNITGA